MEIEMRLKYEFIRETIYTKMDNSLSDRVKIHAVWEGVRVTTGIAYDCIDMIEEEIYESAQTVEDVS